MRTNNNKETKNKNPKYVIIYKENNKDKVLGADNLDLFQEFLYYVMFKNKNIYKVDVYRYKQAQKHNLEILNKLKQVLTNNNVEEILNITRKFESII